MDINGGEKTHLIFNLKWPLPKKPKTLDCQLIGGKGNGSSGTLNNYDFPQYVVYFLNLFFSLKRFHFLPVDPYSVNSAMKTKHWPRSRYRYAHTHVLSKNPKHAMHDVTCKHTRSHTRIMINKHTRDMIHETEIASGHHTTKQNKKRKRKERKKRPLRGKTMDGQ